MRSIHILHHSISAFADQIPDTDPHHCTTGLPLLYARAIRSRYPEFELEYWRPEHTLRRPYAWKDNAGITHRIFPSVYIRFNLEISLPLLASVRALRRARETYIWVHGIYNLHAYLLANLLQFTPTIAQSHGGFPAMAMFQTSRHRWLRYVYLPLYQVEKVTLPKYPHIFALGTIEEAYIRTLLPGSRVSISPTGLDFDHFSPGDKTQSRRACGLNNDDRIVIYVGRLAREKGCEYLIESFADVSRRFGDARLFFIGSGRLQSSLQSLANQLNLGSNIHFVGYVPPSSLPNWYRAADVAVIPSPIDWFPKVAMESMACGTPIVMTEGGGAVDIVREFECGVLVPARDPSRLAEAIARVLARSVGTQPNIERARRALDWSVKLSNAFHVFESMASSSSRFI